MKWIAKAYQRVAIKHALDCYERGGGCAILLEPGMGKSSITLAVFTLLKRDGKVGALLVVAPRRALLSTWPAEVAKWDQFAGLRVQVIGGTPKERLAALAPGADVYLLHYDLLPWLRDVMIGRNPPTLPFDMLAADESSKLKNPSTQRFKALARLLPGFKFRMVLSGTPTPLHIGDLFGQVFVCDLGKRLGTKISAFRNEYMRAKWLPGVPAPIWEAQADAEARVFPALQGLALRLAAVDHLDMPTLHHNTVTVRLPADVATLYRKFKRELVVDMDAGKVTAASAAAGSMKLRQIASGIVYTSDGAAHVLHSEKADALLDLLDEQAGQPLLVAVAFRSEIAHLQRVLKDAGYGAIPSLAGGVSDADAARTIAAWNAGKLPVLLCHPTTVAHGLNLQGGGHAVCWFSATFNLEEYLQFNARVWRQGQRSPHVVVHHLVAEGTIDAHIDTVLRAKDARQNALFAALEAHARGER